MFMFRPKKYRCVRKLKRIIQKRIEERWALRHMASLRRKISDKVRKISNDPKIKSYCINIVLSIVSGLILWVGCEIRERFNDQTKEQETTAINKALEDLDTVPEEVEGLRRRMKDYINSPGTFRPENKREQILIGHLDQRLAEQQTAFNHLMRRESRQKFDEIQSGITELLDITAQLKIDPLKIDSCLEALPFGAGAQATEEAIRDLGTKGTVSPVVEKLLLSFAKYLFAYSEEMLKEAEILKRRGDQHLAYTLEAIQDVVMEESSVNLSEVYAQYKKKRGKEEEEMIGLFIKAAMVKMDFDEACLFYEDLIKVAPEAENHFDYAKLLHSLNDMNNAISHYRRAMNLFQKKIDKKPRTYKSRIADILNSMAVLFQKCNDLEKAKEHYHGALKIYKQLAKHNPRAYNPDVAKTLNNLGNLLNNLNDPEHAEKHFTEALRVYRQLAGQDPQTYLPHVATILNNLAILLKKTNNPEEARKKYEESLSIKRELATKNPQTYLPGVATTLNNMATLLLKMGEVKTAQSHYEEALEIRRRLAKQNPKAFLPNLAASLSHLALLLRNTNQLASAQTKYEEALDIYRHLASQNSEAYKADIGMVLNNLALLYSLLKQDQKARETYNEALAVRKGLALQSPATYEIDYAVTLLVGNTILGYSDDRMTEIKTILKKYPGHARAEEILNQIEKKADTQPEG